MVTILRTLWCVFLIQLTSAGDSNAEELRKGEFAAQDILSGSTLWVPNSNLKEYHNFQDAKVYALNVPVYVSEMHLIFVYVGYYSGSKLKKPCNKTITVLLQHGSPAIPYRDAINTKHSLYNNSDVTYKTVISLGRRKQTYIRSPSPGIWYVTAFLPYVEKSKKIKEKGLSKSDEKCLCALEVLKQLISPKQAAVVIGRGQTLKNAANISKQTVKYYKYFIPDHSVNLTIELRNHCSLKNESCSLRLSVSAKALPSSDATNCTTSDHNCTLLIKWPQPATIYYIKVTGTSSSYDITADHTDCKKNTPGCFHVYEITYVQRSGLSSHWQSGFVLNTTRAFYSFEILPNYVGTTLSFYLKAESSNNNATYELCLRKDSPPYDMLESTFPPQQYCNSKNITELPIVMKVLFPQSGKWYIGVTVQSEPEPAKILLYARANACLDPRCGGHGSCVVTNDIGISYGVCICDYGYTGWTCADYHGLDILAVCLLTISNIAFVPGIILACKRKFYPEAIVYLFNMYCSTVYHACDSHGRCIYDYNTLQLSDFFASVLSVWFTLMIMVKFSPLWHRTMNILALLCLFIGIQLSRFGVTVIAVSAGVGLAIVLVSFASRSHYRHKFYPSTRRWLFFILPAAVLAIVAVTVFTCFETTANYKYLHSIWHICIALCIPLLLPTVRKAQLFVEYNMIQQLDEGENFHESADSLLLNPWNTTQNDGEDENDSETAREPRLIGENNPELKV